MIREFYDLSAEERAAHEAKWGNGNSYPPGWRRITEEEYAKSAFTWTPCLYEFRQMIARDANGDPTQPDDPELPLWAVSAALEFQPDGQTGFCVVPDFWGGRVRFYKFGCADPVHGANRVKCPTCGWHPDYDTSD